MPRRTLTELARLCGATLDGDGARLVDGPADLGEAGPNEISFFAHPRYKEKLAATRAGAVIVALDCDVPRRDAVFLRVKDPSRAFTQVVQAFQDPVPPPVPGVHPSAVVEAGAHVAASASIGPLCHVAAGARLGERVVLHAGVSIGHDTAVGDDSVLHPGVRLYPRVTVGARCILHAGTVVGSDGFGFEPTREGWVKIPQVGTVVVEDDVEIGANCALDRGRFGATRIGRGAKLDNLVHVAHNVIVGESALLIAQVGIAGSATIGKRAILAGQVGVAGHTHVGDGARLGGQSGVVADIPAGQDYMGTPAHPRGDALRQWTLTARLPELNQRVRALEQKLAALERAVSAAGEDSP